MLDRVFAALPGWLFLCAGLTLLAVCLLTPAWLEHREMAWQRDLMQLQADRLGTQAQRYDQFHDALRTEDPVLLERLAYTQLRLKPSDKNPLVLAPDQRQLSPLPRTAPEPARLGSAPRLMATVEDWLAEPMPRVGRDVPPLEPVNTRLTRLTTGQTRYALVGVGLVCVAAGIWWTGRPTSETA